MASFTPHIAFKGPPFLSEQADEDTDVEADLEVDQLDSDTDPEEHAGTTKPTKNKNGSTRPGERVPGHTLLPATRIENMLKADGITSDISLSKEGLYVLSVATEEFIKRLIQAGHREASAHRRNQINYTDMATTTRQYQEFMCLNDTIPAPVTLKEALVLRQERERQLYEENPAFSSSLYPTPAPPAPSILPSPEPELATITTLSPPKPSKKAKNGNGKEKTNGSAVHKRPYSRKQPKTSLPASDATMQVDHQQRAAESSITSLEQSQNNRRFARNGMSAAASSMPPHVLNGHSTGLSPAHSPQSYSDDESMNTGPPPPPPHDPHALSHSPPYDSAWTQNHYVGPASGFLHGQPPPPPPFAHASQNPGRTIYQTHRPD
ncbi:hypothetical protein D9613_006044 [Agrocybe pediades]|uniref:Transcription factor CBF/NF-Y/archaeal histone domain-containing protein n=1 Tax=Agrocybe pediades TaxID=84607 RepID=A0A8H4QW51_9AGAR|nr:hypothetical protein D9613_006044 [Agrocybe pediades]